VRLTKCGIAGTQARATASNAGQGTRAVRGVGEVSPQAGKRASKKVKVVARMVHLIGVGNHLFQHDADTSVQLALDEREKFKKHVSVLIDKYDFALLAEEFSDEARRMAQASATMLQQFAKETGIKHRFCDPNSRERKEHGIGKLDHDKRERYWIEQIKDYKDRKMLFVCAYSHFDSFAEKLTAAGFTVQRERKMQHFSDRDLIRAAWEQE
jgi:hypothetical protein